MVSFTLTTQNTTTIVDMDVHLKAEILLLISASFYVCMNCKEHSREYSLTRAGCPADRL